MDIMLPVLNGLAIIAKIRDRKINTPVLVLSAKRSVDEIVRGLQAGGDDYLIKPFTFSELLARVQALVRRASGAVEPARLVFGELSVDLLKREVVRNGRKIDLQPREFALLEYLMRNSTRVVSKTMIWNTCGGTILIRRQTSLTSLYVASGNRWRSARTKN